MSLFNVFENIFVRGDIESIILLAERLFESGKSSRNGFYFLLFFWNVKSFTSISTVEALRANYYD